MTYAEVNKVDVEQACERLIQRFELEIGAKREKMIQDRCHSGWFFPRARQEAVEWLDRQERFHPWHMTGFELRCKTSRARELLSLAKVATSVVRLSAEDASLLQPFWSTEGVS